MKRVAFIFIALLLQGGVAAQDLGEKQGERERLEREIELLDRQLSNNRSEQRTSVKELNFIQKKISNRKLLIVQLEKELKSIELEGVARERELDSIKSNLERVLEGYSTLIYNAYKNRDQESWLLFILASRDIKQGFRRWEYLKSYSNAINSVADSIIAKQERVQKRKEELEQLYSTSLQRKEQRESENHSLVKEEQRYKTIVQNLSKREREFRRTITQKRGEVERLNREIERMLAEATRESSRAEEAEIKAARVLSGNFESNRGKLPWPVDEGVIIEPFGEHNHPVFKHIKLPFNNGVTISTSLHAPVRAIFDGVVKQIIVMPGYNQCILIQHGEYYTFYTKIESVEVATGSRVSTGDILGRLTDSEGNSTIHFQLWRGTTKQNPEVWISK
ncbi:MAG: peptidoglycan DD-metalloendopeptidase family protein [Bacteroidales bacterium]